MTIALVVAVATNGVIGRDGTIPWHLPGEQAHFKRLTMGHVLVMGRRTYESIGRPLPGRTTVVVTRDPDWAGADGVRVATSVEQALTIGQAVDDTVFVVGGAEIYRAALPYADTMLRSEIACEPAGDTVFPDVDWSRWLEAERDRRNGYDFVVYRRAKGETRSGQALHS